MGRRPVPFWRTVVLSGWINSSQDPGLDYLESHDYRIVRLGTGKAGNVLLRGRVGTLSYFGLCALPRLDTAYERQGGIQIGKWRTSPRKVSWQGYRIAIPEKYDSCSRWKGWSIALSANHRQYDLVTLAHAIEASGVPWVGFQNKNGGRHLMRESLIGNSSHVKP